MRIELKHIVFVFLTAAGMNLYSQQLPTYTQYLNNGFLINPAVAGAEGYTTFNTTYRKQWIGIKNSPTTYSISGQTRLLRQSYRIVNRNVKKNVLKPSTKGRVGLGGFAFNDQNGLINRTGLSFSYAYHIYLLKSQISFGLSGMAYQYRIDGSKLDFGSIEDPIQKDGLNLVTFVPDANAGFYWSSETYFLGVSANQLFQSVLKIGSSDLGKLKLYRHYYIMGGYKFQLNEIFELEPSALLKTTEQFLPQYDVSLRLIYQSNYWAGVSYRSSGSASALLGIKANKLYMGLAYDYSLTSIRRRSYGSAEVVISVKFGDSARRYRWINRY